MLKSQFCFLSFFCKSIILKDFLVFSPRSHVTVFPSLFFIHVSVKTHFVTIRKTVYGLILASSITLFYLQDNHSTLICFYKTKLCGSCKSSLPMFKNKTSHLYIFILIFGNTVWKCIFIICFLNTVFYSYIVSIPFAEGQMRQ